jgi:hypothetical protein
MYQAMGMQEDMYRNQLVMPGYHFPIMDGYNQQFTPAQRRSYQIRSIQAASQAVVRH